MSDEKEKELKTPTDVLIQTMEDADNIEDILVIYTGKNKMIYYKSNTDSLSMMIGMMTIMKENMLGGSYVPYEHDDDDDDEENKNEDNL